MRFKTDHKTNEKLEDRASEVGNEDGAVPEDQGDNKEGHGLRKRIDGIAVDGGAVRANEGLFERLTINTAAVAFTSE